MAEVSLGEPQIKNKLCLAAKAPRRPHASHSRRCRKGILRRGAFEGESRTEATATSSAARHERAGMRIGLLNYGEFLIVYF